MTVALGSHLLVYHKLEKKHLQCFESNGVRQLELWLAEPHIPWRDPQKLERFKEMLYDFQIVVPSVHLPFYPSVPELLNQGIKWSVIADKKKQREIAIQGAAEGIAAAATLGAHSAVLHLGWQRDFWNDFSHGWAREAVQRLMSVAKKQNIKLLLENIISEGTRIDSLMNLLAEIDPEKTVGICLDLGHANIEGEILEILKQASSRLDHIHVHDNNGKEDSHLCPGQGSIPWDKVLDILEDKEFNGIATLELRDYSRGLDEATETIEQHIKDCKPFYNSWKQRFCKNT
jgi:sugar phosphate isomerase/epimerase